MNNVLVTGANGFIGRALCERMLIEGCKIRGTVRSSINLNDIPSGVYGIQIGSIGPDTNWKEALIGVDMVVHLVSPMRLMKDSLSKPFAEYQKVNAMGSKRLVLTAAELGVKRFIFMSSVKVNGEENIRAYKESDTPAPKDSYGISKMQAEKLIKEISAESDMDFVILRPPLVFGPGVKANFLELIKTVYKGIPLPLGNIDNQRSLIYLENLVDAVLTCMKHPRAAGQTYFVSDDEDISTPELIRKIASALAKPARLFFFPKFFLSILGRLVGKGPMVDSLTKSLTVDISEIKEQLGWRPPFTMEQGLQKTAEWYLNERRR